MNALVKHLWKRVLETVDADAGHSPGPRGTDPDSMLRRIFHPGPEWAKAANALEELGYEVATREDLDSGEVVGEIVASSGAWFLVKKKDES